MYVLDDEAVAVAVVNTISTCPALLIYLTPTMKDGLMQINSSI